VNRDRIQTRAGAARISRAARGNLRNPGWRCTLRGIGYRTRRLARPERCSQVVGGFLALALLAPGAEPARAVGLQKGDELTYTGTVSEGANRVGNRFRRAHALEIRVLVLEASDRWADAAVLTVLRRTDDAVSGAVADLTGTGRAADAPPLVRLDLVRVHADGTAHALVPVGPPPLTLDAKTPARGLPVLPLDCFAPFEFGMFPPRAPRNSNGDPWTVASAEARGPETWQDTKTEFVTGERCALLVMNQSHPNWDKPVGGKPAWHRADAVWVSTLDGTARKLHRVIKHRDGIETDLAAWVEVKFEVKDRGRAVGRTFDRARRDIETAFAAAGDAAPFLADAAKHGPRAFESRIQKLDSHLSASDATSAYREAVVAVRRQLDAAKRGQPVAKVAGPLAPVALPKPLAWPAVGAAAPDFASGPFKLSARRGQPVVLIFYKPGSETAPLTLAIADALHAKHAGRAAVVPLAVWAEQPARPTGAPVYDGSRAELVYGVESVPRFAVLDARGVVTWSFAGAGAETGFAVNEQLERLLAPAPPSSATGTLGAPNPGTAPGAPPPR